MAKPIITKRLVKGAALDYQELDDNFQNIIDSILTVTDGTSDINLELIDTLEITGDHNIKITATPSGNIVTVDNELPVITKSPHGFENIIDTSLSFDDTTRTFTITLDPLLDDFSVFLAGEEFLKTATETVVIPNVTGLYLIYYNSSGVLSQKTGYLTFGQEAAVAHVYWNATNSEYKLADQRHGVTMDWKTHEYLHRTRGASFASGFAASNYTLTGDGSANADAQIDLSSGTFYDEDLKINITHSNTPTANTYQQDLQGPAQIPVAYHSGSTGEWVFDTATDYPIKVGTIAKYNLNTAGTWTTPDITSTHYVAMWLVATNFYDTPIIAIMGQRTDNKLEDSENNNTWDGLDLTNFPSEEFLPLYRLIFRSSTAYTNTPKSYLAEINDLRQAVSGAGTGVSLAPNSWGTIAVSGQNSVIADSVNDTLTLVAGTGITLTTSDTADSVTIATSGSGTVNTGVANALAYYPSAGTTVDDSSFTQVATGHLSTIGANDLILSTNSNTNSSNITINDGISGTVNINTELSYLSIKRNGSSGLIKVDGESGFIYSENSDNLSLYAVGTTSPTINLNAANGNITVTAGSTGDVLLNADTLRVGDSNANATITTNGTGDLILNTNTGTNSGSITIADGTNGNITIAPNGTGKIDLNGALKVANNTATPVNINQPIAYLQVDVPVTARTAKTITANGNAASSSVQSKFGGGSVALDGTGDYLSITTTTDFGFGTGDFTIEAWAYKSTASQQVFIDTRTASTEVSVYVESNAAGNLRLFVNGVYQLTSSNAMSTTTWQHIAISRTGGITRFFINGVVSTNIYTDTNDYGSTKPANIGASWTGGTAWNGYLDDIRITKGVGRYETSFVPPTVALKNDIKTVLLVNGNTNISDDVTDNATYYLPLYQ